MKGTDEGGTGRERRGEIYFEFPEAILFRNRIVIYLWGFVWGGGGGDPIS